MLVTGESALDLKAEGLQLVRVAFRLRMNARSRTCLMFEIGRILS
jgi:hypothetical protein